VALGAAVAAVAIGQAVAGHAGQKRQQSAQLKAQKQAHMLAQRRFAEQTSALQAERNAARDKFTQAKIEKRLETMRAKASARVAAGAAGVGGLSLDAVMLDIGGAGGRAQTALGTSYDNQLASIGTRQRLANFELSAARQRNKTPVFGPSMLSLGLGIATGALQGFGAYSAAAAAAPAAGGAETASVGTGTNLSGGAP
jgi:hypothetical protein